MKNSFLVLNLIFVGFFLNACASYKTDEDGISWVDSPRCEALRNQVHDLRIYFMELAKNGHDYAVKCVENKDKKYIAKYKAELEKFREFQGTDAMTSWSYNLDRCTKNMEERNKTFELMYNKEYQDVLQSVYTVYFTCSNEKEPTLEERKEGKYPKGLEEMARFKYKQVMYYR